IWGSLFFLQGSKRVIVGSLLRDLLVESIACRTGSIIDDINSIFSRFLWHGSNTDKKTYPNFLEKSMLSQKRGRVGV
ncbi:hypothetical protein GIB67_007882, partial [Kingdonia uniflora]